MGLFFDSLVKGAMEINGDGMSRQEEPKKDVVVIEGCNALESEGALFELWGCASSLILGFWEAWRGRVRLTRTGMGFRDLSWIV